jgi:hypothetical protein
MTTGLDLSVIIAGLEQKVASLQQKRAALQVTCDAIDSERASLEVAVDALRSASNGTPLSSKMPVVNPLSVQHASITAISPRSPKSPTYGSFSGRYTLAPPPPTKPDHGPVPVGATDDWVSMVASHASPYALCLAILRAHNRDTITSPELNAALAKVRGIQGGAGYTTLEPLEKAGVIEGNHSGWHIRDRKMGGVIAGKYLWCDTQYLNIYDWAAVRREAIKILLTESPKITNAAVTKSLQQCDWLKAPVTPHLVKADLRSMEMKNLARMDEVDKTWELIRQV